MLYDGVCVFCSRATHFILKHERAPLVRFVALQSAEGQRLARTYGIDAADPNTLLFIEDGRMLTKSGGVMALTRYLRQPAALLGVAWFIPRPLRDWVYDRVARNRYSIFGKSETCIVPPASQRHRFSLPDPA